MFPYIMLNSSLDENELAKNSYTYDIVIHFKNPINLRWEDSWVGHFAILFRCLDFPITFIPKSFFASLILLTQTVKFPT